MCASYNEALIVLPWTQVRSSLSTHIFDMFVNVGQVVESVSDVNVVATGGGPLALMIRDLGDVSAAPMAIDATSHCSRRAWW
jgi:hypothetical protein